MFVWGLSKLVCSETFSFDTISTTGWVQAGNPGYIDLGQEGFREPYHDTDQNSQKQVNHFVAYVQAGYYGGPALALAHLYRHEGGNTEGADWALGLEGIFVGSQLRLYYKMDWPINKVGFEPSEVDWYIRTFLADPTWEPNEPNEPNKP